ncbi:hypothetical protein E4Z66_19270 [Aliishimia ponticola]|uniref:Oxidoreductase n=1 Tax=Aliishimia ponticola TaxID=2499833 RepID=A0A4S4N5A8_9RHOB|nr:hypothetical protein [Aliishimia ponticola]THH34254.1 hypothetical protein E4Z66_19270 [Aliishimia ponticola]
MRQILGFWIACFIAVASFAAHAAQLGVPHGRVLLEVSGQIGNTNGDGVARFDREMLEALDWREVETYTSFTEGLQRFAGPTLASLLEAVAADGTKLHATAINDYYVVIPTGHADEHDVILALDHDGKPMRVRDKGPIWVVYPLEEAEAGEKPFDTEMIWQLNRLSVR